MVAKLMRVAKIIFLGLLLTGLSIGTAGGSEPVYYSIHVASFKKLENAEGKVNSLIYVKKPVFFKKTDIPGEGRFYRVYLGKFEKKDEAIAYWEILKDLGEVRHFGIHYFNEILKPPEYQSAHRDKVLKKDRDISRFDPLPLKNRFVDHQNGTITDVKTKLMWVKNGWRIESLSAVTWWQAVDKCKDFNHGGYGNWRLPSIQEWRSLIDPRNQNPALVEPNPFKNIISHMPYWSKSDYTYGLEQNYNQPSSFSYIVILYSGSINHQKKKDKAFVMPVRSIKSRKLHKKYSQFGPASHMK